MIKIIAGEFRSRQLKSPDDESVSRPYSSRVKESVFNLLRGWFDGTTVVDLFSGVGTMGLEALSRGAAKVVLVERDRRIFELLQENVQMLSCEDRAVAMNNDVLSLTWLPRVPKPVDVIFVDPPYMLMEDEKMRPRVLEMISKCRGLFGDQGFVVLRSPIAADKADFGIEGFFGPEPHQFSQEMNVLLYSPAASAQS